MKLIIRQYLASLRERNELDAILPDLLSQLGLNVFSRPARGTRQDGVDVGAVGSLDGGEKVYLFSIKAGDLGRRDWDNDLQSLRPSLNEILDSYIPNRLPPEHRGKPIVVCICLGGDVQEQMRPPLKGFIDSNSRDNLTFEEWNGDKLAALIESSFLREDLLPEGARSSLRKSLALLDEPASSYDHFAVLVRSLATTKASRKLAKLTALRQMALCLWILFVWCRDAGNTEAAYLSAELALLHGWKIAKAHLRQRTRTGRAFQMAFLSLYMAYEQIYSEFLSTQVLLHVGKRHALSAAVRGCDLDVNLKMFDLAGRVGVAGLWAHWLAMRVGKDQVELRERALSQERLYSESVKAMVANNRVLFHPIKDDQAIDVALVLALLALDAGSADDIRRWLDGLLQHATFTYHAHLKYPSTLRAYSDLLAHPKRQDNEYQKEVTAGSILYPLIAVWAALLGDEHLYERVAALKREDLQHCNFQLWYPDEVSEEHLYSGTGSHGAALTEVRVDLPSEELLEQVFGECENGQHFEELSAVKYGWWPLVLVACRHHRIPFPICLLKGLRNKPEPNSAAEAAQESTR